MNHKQKKQETGNLIPIVFRKRLSPQVGIQLNPKKVLESLKTDEGRMGLLDDLDNALKEQGNRGLLYVHDLDTLLNLINADTQGKKVEELYKLMRISETLGDPEISRDGDTTIRITRYMADILINHLKGIRLNQMRSDIVEFLMDFFRSTGAEFERDLGEDFTIQVD